MKSVAECISYLVAYNGSLHIAHWLADTKLNTHKALGDLYESMVDLTDEFAEVYMGKYGLIEFPKDCCIEDITEEPATEGIELVSKIEGELNPKEDSDLLNITADMMIALNKAKYLLKEVSKPETDEKGIKNPSAFE